MNWDDIAFDWNQVRAFLAASEEGSLSAAARKLDLTVAGLELLEHVRVMAEAANLVSLAASGQSQAVEGRVCITATEMLATCSLPPILRQLRELAPGIVVEVVASDEVRDLTRREADIAIRHTQPTQPDLIARCIGFLRGRIYGARRLLDEVGMPRSFEDLSHQDFIGIDNTEGLIVALAEQGLEFGFLPMDIGARFDDLICVLPERFDPEIPVWIVSHRAS